MKKVFAVLLTIIMLSLAAMPAYAYVQVNGYPYTDDFILQDGAIQYIKAEKKLILKGANIETDRAYPIRSDNGDIEAIELIGENTITTADDSYGLSFDGADVRIYGSGSLKSTAGFSPLMNKDGSLTIDGADVEIVNTDIMECVYAKGDIILTNGARLKTTQKSMIYSAVNANYGERKIEISGNSRLVIDSYMKYAPYGGMFRGEYVKLSDTSGIEIVSSVDSRPAEDVYNASDVYLVSKADDRFNNIFSIDRFISAKDNRFTVTQTVEEDGRYKLVIQGEEVDDPAEIPETGDHADLALYAGMMLAGAGALILMKKRGEA